MTTNHSRRCWNTLYMYKVDLLWVWIGWDVSIITLHMIQVRNQVNCLLPLPHLFKEHISGWKCTLMTTGHSWKSCNTLYIYKVDLLWVWSEWGVSIIIYSMIQVRERESPTVATVTVILSTYQTVVASLWALAAIALAETCYICTKKDLLSVWSGWSAPIIVYLLTQVRNRVNILLPLTLWDSAHIRLGVHPHDHWPQ